MQRSENRTVYRQVWQKLLRNAVFKKGCFANDDGKYKLENAIKLQLKKLTSTVCRGLTVSYPNNITTDQPYITSDNVGVC
jgi:hypothetical protein